MTRSFLLDSNLLVYSFDDPYSGKQERALEPLNRLGRGPIAALPVQVLAEFSSVILCKM